MDHVNLIWDFGLGPKKTSYQKQATVNGRPAMVCKVTGEKCVDSYKVRNLRHGRSCRNCVTGYEYFMSMRKEREKCPV